MKYFLLFATLLCLTGIACKKHKVTPLDILPGTWELRSENARTAPGVPYRFGADKTFTRTINGNVQSGTYLVQSTSEQYKTIDLVLTADQNVVGSMTLHMVSIDEFKLNQVFIGPGPGTSPQILLRIK